MKEVQAILFDMDGVIYDTEKIFQVAFVDAGNKYGFDDPEGFFHKIQGLNRVALHETYDEIYGKTGIPFEEYYAEVFAGIDRIRDGKEPPMKETVREFLDYLKEKQIPAALVTSTKSETVMRDLKWSGIDTCFDVVICGDMVTHGKPDPEGYLKAAAALHADPAYAYVIEDSHNGIRAAHNGAFHPIMIPDTMDVTEEMKELSEAILPDMTALKNYLFD